MPPVCELDGVPTPCGLIAVLGRDGDLGALPDGCFTIGPCAVNGRVVTFSVRANGQIGGCMGLSSGNIFCLVAEPMRNDFSWWGAWASNLFSNWSWGVRTPNQTYKQCLAQNSSNYSLAGALNQQGKFAQLIAGNDVASALFGNADEGTAGLIVVTGAEKSLAAGAGTALTFGRRTASIFNLNLSGTTGPAPAALGKTGAKGAIATAAAYKFAADVGATIALLGGCLTHP